MLVCTGNAGIVPAAAVVISTHIQRWQSIELVFLFVCFFNVRHIRMTRSSKKMWATKRRHLTWLWGCRMTQERRGAETRQWIKMTRQNIKVTIFFFFLLLKLSLDAARLLVHAVITRIILVSFAITEKRAGWSQRSSLRWWLMTTASAQLEKFQNDKRGIMSCCWFFFFSVLRSKHSLC